MAKNFITICAIILFSAPLLGAEGIFGYYQAYGYNDLKDGKQMTFAIQDGNHPTDTIGKGYGYRVEGTYSDWSVLSWLETYLTQPTELPWRTMQGQTANSYRLAIEDSTAHQYRIYWGTSNFQFGYSASTSSGSRMSAGSILWTIEETQDGHFYLCWNNNSRKNYLCYDQTNQYFPFGLRGPSITGFPISNMVNQFEQRKPLDELASHSMNPAAWTIYVQSIGYPLHMSLADNATWTLTSSSADSLSLKASMRAPSSGDIQCQYGSLAGWAYRPYAEPEDIVYEPSDYFELTDSVTLYAVYSIPRQTIRCHLGSHAWMSVPEWKTGWSFVVPKPEVEDGYSFRGWTLVEGSTYPDYPVGSRYPDDQTQILPTGDVDLYAVVEKAFDIIEWSSDAVVVQYRGEGTSVNVWTDHGNKTNTQLSTIQLDNAIYRIPFSPRDVQMDAGYRLHLDFLNAQGTSIGEAVTKIPIIISAEVRTSAVSVDALNNASVAVLPNANLVVDKNNVQLMNVDVFAGGKLTIQNGISTSIHSLILHSGTIGTGEYQYQYPQLVVNGQLSVDNDTIVYQYMMNTANNQYVTCAFPCPVRIGDFTYWNGAKLTLGQTLWLDEYDGAARASTGGTGWKAISNANRTIFPGEGLTMIAAPQRVLMDNGMKVWQKYAIITIPLAISKPFIENIEKTIPITPHMAAKPNDSGWNLISNPYFATYNGSADGLLGVDGIGMLVLDILSQEYSWVGNIRYVVIPDDYGLSYRQVRTNRAVLPAFKNFFVQIGAHDASRLSFPINQRAQSVVSRKSIEPLQEQFCELTIMAPDLQTDLMGILIDSAYTDAYEVNADMQKWMNKGLNMYALSKGDVLAYLAINDSMAQHVSIECQLPQKGVYQVSLTDETDLNWVTNAYLYDEQQKVTVDLKQSDYKFTITAPSNAYHFTLCLTSKNISTNISAMFPNADQCTKILRRGHLLIQRGGHVYSVSGDEMH